MEMLEEHEVERVRGDTDPIVFRLWEGKKTDNTLLDFTGWTFIMTVDPDADPLDASANLFSLVGILDLAEGTVTFEPTEAQMDITPDTYYYDFQRINTSNKIKTLIKNKFIVPQDITKQGVI